jgi:lipoteichoic acid synthase
VGVEHQETTPAAPGLLSTWGLTLTLPLGIVFLLVTAVVKGLQISKINGTFSLVVFLQAWAPDIAVATTLTFLFAVLFSAFRRKVIIPAGIIYYLFVSYALFITTVSFGYFQATGANFSWSLFHYWLLHLGSTWELVKTEVTFGRLFLLGSSVAFLFLAALGPHLPPVKKRLLALGAMRRRTALVILGSATVATAVFSVIPKAQGPAMAVCRNVAWDILTDFVAEEILPEEEVVIAQSERLDSSIEFSEPETPSRPNVVFILFESLNWKSSDVYTPGLGTTPFLAELAPEAWVVDRQYTVVPHTTKALVGANCGIYPYLDAGAKETTPGILPRRCLGHVLGSVGYETAFFAPVANFEHRSTLVSNMGYKVVRLLDDMPQEGFEDTNYFGKEERMMLRPSLDWVKSLGGRPFLLTFLTLTSHHNYVVPRSFPYRDYPTADHDQRNFFNTLRYTDQFIREFWEGLEELGQAENTVLIIIGDHGEAFSEHGRRQHDLIMWEEGLRSFGMLYSPKYLPGSGRIEGYRSHLDIVPTVVDLLGMKLTKGNFLGQSLLQPAPDDRKLLTSCWFKRRCAAIREGPIKLIYHFGVRPSEVYDNSSDPYDEHNLAFTGSFGEDFISVREEEIDRWEKVVNQQYDEWGEKLTEGVVWEQEPPIANRLEANFGDKIRLVGYEVIPKSVRAGQDLTIKLVFQCLKSIPESTALFVHLDNKGKFMNADHVPGRGSWPMDKWEEGQYIVDEHEVHIPGTWPGGKAKLYVGFWDRKTKGRLRIGETEAEVESNRVLVTNFKVKGATQSTGLTLRQRRQKIASWLPQEAPTMESPLKAVFGDRVELAGLNPTRMDVQLAGTVEMTYLFKALKEIPSNWKLTVKLVRKGGGEVNGDHVPIGGLYPPVDWQEGEFVVDRHTIHIDMHRTRTGTYDAWLGFTAGGRPVSVETDMETDSHHRVHLGEVTIVRGQN